jgi:hypothetical protein
LPDAATGPTRKAARPTSDSDQCLGSRRFSQGNSGRCRRPIRKAGSPHRWTNLEYGASAVFHAAGANPHSERPGPRSDGRSVFLFRFFAISEIENANRRLGLARVRGSASSDPRGAYAASKTADTPYSKLATQSARLGLHPGRPKTPTADWASLVCGVPPVQIRAGLTPHRRRRTRRTPSWRPYPKLEAVLQVSRRTSGGFGRGLP